MVELADPFVGTHEKFSKVSFELEEENISWDLIMTPEMFEEKSSPARKSLLLGGVLEENFSKNAEAGVLRQLSGPLKIRFQFLRS